MVEGEPRMEGAESLSKIRVCSETLTLKEVVGGGSY